MKLGDKEIKTGLEVGRDIRSPSITQKIEERIRQEIIEKYGKILSSFEMQQITGREKERQEKRKDSLERSRFKILKMKDKAILIQDVRRAVQEGTLFKRRKKLKGEVREIAPRVIEEIKEVPEQKTPKENMEEKTEEPTETLQPSEEQEEQVPPESSEETPQEETVVEEPQNEEQPPSQDEEKEGSEKPQPEEKKDETQSKPNIKPRNFDY